jgi:hypothetical protein
MSTAYPAPDAGEGLLLNGMDFLQRGPHPRLLKHFNASECDSNHIQAAAKGVRCDSAHKFTET